MVVLIAPCWPSLWISPLLQESTRSYIGVVPKTTPPCIRPSNGKIIRGPYQKFWILSLMEVFYMYIWLTAPTFTPDDWKVEVVWYFIDALALMNGNWYSLSSFWYHELIGGWIFLLLDSFWWYVHDWTHLSLYLSFKRLPSGLSLFTLLTLPMTLFTLQRVFIFYLSNDFIFTRLVF